MNTCTTEMVRAWEKESRTITLTNAEWNKLTTYLIMSANYREREAEAWEKLSTETKDDGTPKFEHAKSNAEFWKDMDAKLKQIREKIDG